MSIKKPGRMLRGFQIRLNIRENLLNKKLFAKDAWQTVASGKLASFLHFNVSLIFCVLL
jgi:hypothetical protein